ncbi:HD-GYP domain-containing protein [Paracidobacterium acidisoli]|uniref:HD-GYP domain-containing protein n=1 Tax=Paracidobacterium acidisoli TaxID=2303751 RepID=A0A372ITV6_9BACT|nr:HD-GYP domain-containing protein [Paracidobacterium acidisoli]MBT9329632.1 HD-GYP domain-containing protein [Paracidobacterium acidisoli]
MIFVVLEAGAPVWAAVTAGILAGVLASAAASWWWSRRLARQNQQLVRQIEASFQQQRSVPEEREWEQSLFSGIAQAWETAAYNFRNAWSERHAAARRNYQALTELMQMTARAVDERVSYLRGHSDRVAVWSEMIAREMGLDAEQTERIRLAALLHDIGTIGIENYIVMKETPLSPEEFDIVKAHTVKGASILRPIEALEDLIPGIELHHESLDGLGYPYGLRGEEIPLMPRIIAVADSFDAMTSSRPWQQAMNPAYVVEVLTRLAEKRYDPAVVAALTALFRRGEIEVKNSRPPVSFRLRRPAGDEERVV